MHDRVLHASHVDINRHPLLHLLNVERSTGVLRISKPQVIPGGVHKSVHRIYFSLVSHTLVHMIYKVINQTKRLAFSEQICISNRW